jgi:hypothetical protein
MEGKCNAFLLADRVIREDNGKIGIIGSFNTLNLPQYPTTCPPFMIYANLEDFTGEQEFSINIIKDGAEVVIFSHGGEIQFRVENSEANLIIPVFGMQIPKDGTYKMILTIGGYQFASRRIIVNKINLTKQGDAI